MADNTYHIDNTPLAGYNVRSVETQDATKKRAFNTVKSLCSPRLVINRPLSSGSQHGRRVEALATIMQIGNKTFVNITQAFPDITRKHCGANASVIISSGVCRITTENVWRNTKHTCRGAIEELLVNCRYCRHASDLIDTHTTRWTFHYHDTEVWAYAQEDHLGRTFVKILLPAETRQELGNRRFYRRNHTMEVAI